MQCLQLHGCLILTPPTTTHPHTRGPILALQNNSVKQLEDRRAETERALLQKHELTVAQERDQQRRSREEEKRKVCVCVRVCGPVWGACGRRPMYPALFVHLCRVVMTSFIAVIVCRRGAKGRRGGR